MGQKAPDDDEATELPSWTMPTIRALCRALATPTAAPHVYAGVSSVSRLAASPATPSRKRPRRSSIAATAAVPSLPALIAVLAFYTLSALSDAAPDETEYLAQRETAVRVLRAHVPPPALEDADADGPDPLVPEIERLMREAKAGGWLEMEWFRNVVPGWADGQGERDAEDEAGEGESEAGDIMVQRGFGAMVTDATDWLSEGRRREYAVWKKGILRRMREIESADKAVALV